MSRSLIRKNQLHPDITDLVGQYGSGYFISISSSGDIINSLAEVVSGDFANTVRVTGNQTISGVKTFASRPTVNNTGVILSGDSLVTHIRPSGTNNVFVSPGALASTSDFSHNNTAVGANALTANIGGDNNVAIGSQSLYSITEGNSNIGIGYLSLFSNTNGNSNIGIGTDALKNCNSPDANIGIGTQAGRTIDDGGSNIIIGHEADVDGPNRQRCIVLGRSAVSPPADGSLVIGAGGGNVMGNLVSNTAGGTANKYLNIYLNGIQYKIELLNPS